MSLKNIIRKSIASLGAISLVLGNCSLCGMGLLEVIAENASMPEIVTEWTNEKYVQYSYNKTVKVDGEEKEVRVKGVAVQSKLSVYPTYEQDTYLPTENVEVSVSLPSINGYLPEKAVVAEVSTKSTTGEENNTSFNQNYDSNSGLLTVSYENTPDENDNIYAEQVENAKDEFKIIYTYSEEAYTGNEEEITLTNSVDVKMTFKKENGSVITENSQSFEMVEKDNRGDILTFGVTELENNIYKGFMYSNVQNQTNHDTEYKTVSTFAVLNSSIVDSVTMELKNAEFILNDKEETKIATNGNVIYKSTEISKLEFDKILGQDGILEIYTGEKLLATAKYVEVSENEEITKKLSVIYADSEIKTLENEETTLVVEYKEDVTSLKINITKPIAEGFMHFVNQNVIKASNDYGYNVEDIKYVSTEGIVNDNLNAVKIPLLEPETKILVDSSNTNFSTLQNSKTTLTITLDDTNASTKLFDNPTITVKLPEGITGGSILNTEVINGNGLTIKSTTANKNIITIQLEGKQTSYDLTSISGGASIVMEIDNITYKETIPTHEDKIEVTCIQGNEEVKESKKVNIVSKPGVLILSSLTVLKNNSTLILMNGESKTVEIETNAEKKEVVQTINLVNNYDDKISNVAIIGRIDYSNAEIESTFETKLTKPIEIANGKVYYSTNTNAIYNDESWTEEFTSNAKSYKVELENNELASKDTYEIRLYVGIPANLECNQANFLNYNMEYVYQERIIRDNVTIGMQTNENELLTNYNVNAQNVETETGKIVPMSISITPVISQNYVHSGQIVTYKIKATNNGEKNLENIMLTSNIPDNAIYTYYQEVESPTGNYKEIVKDESIKQKEWPIDLLKAGEAAEVEMLLTMSTIAEEQEIVVLTNMTYNNRTTENVGSRLILKPSMLQTSLTAADEKQLGIIYQVGDTVNYYIKVKNITDKTLRNAKVQYKIPEELEYIRGGNTSYDEFEGYQIIEESQINNGVFEYNIEKLRPEEEIVLCIIAKVQQLEEKYSRELENVAKVYIENDIYETNVKNISIKQAMFEMSLNVDTKGKEILRKDDEVLYTLTVKNIGENSGIINIEDELPDELDVLSVEYNVNEKDATVIEYVNNEVSLTQLLNVDDILTLKISAKVKNVECLEDTNLTSINQAILKMGELEIHSNEVKIYIKPELKQVETEESAPEEDDGNAPTEQPDDNIGDTRPNIPTDEPLDTPSEELEDKPLDDTTTNEPTDKPEDKPIEEPTDKPEGKPTDKPEDKPTEDQTDKPLDSDSTPEETVKYYTISGIAWLDSNKDGERNSSESVLENINVTLVDKNTGKIAIDLNGNNIVMKTDSNGKYTFSNLVKGNYAILFEFDTIKYTVTTYQKQGIDENKNSDAIVSKVIINGENKNAGLTDTINLTSNKENIDIGLIENSKFDLCLDKEITKITVINSKGTETYEYEEGHTAKVDLVAKYMNGANVIVNYKFTVTNNGDVTGYVNSLVDSLPSGLEFSSELNKDWYKGNDGQLYTTSLSSKAIKPGESIEVELVLTKTMTTENAGTFVNNASLEKISNLENIQEKQETLEDNESSAILIISIKTGSIIMYIGITTICLAIICLGAYLIKKKVLNRGI